MSNPIDMAFGLMRQQQGKKEINESGLTGGFGPIMGAFGGLPELGVTSPSTPGGMSTLPNQTMVPETPMPDVSNLF